MVTLCSVGRPTDPHIIRVHRHLADYDVATILAASWSAEVEQFLRVTWSLSEGFSAPSNCAFWLRNKHWVGAITSAEKQAEWWSFASSMEFFRAAASQSVLSFNGSESPAATDDKIAQLICAKECGFQLPSTLVSNDKDRILNFIEQHGDCIVKPLTASAILPIGDDFKTLIHLPTMQVCLSNVVDRDEAEFRVSPTIFQHRVEKQYELRVVAFGNEIVTFKLGSQERDITSLDWRTYEPLVSCTLVQTPNEIVNPIQQYLQKSGLHSSVFDFAVTPKGEHVFFESNPAGQWARMDDMHDQVVSKMFARQMARIMRETIPN